jgi:GNAT superfamily N-acetyltransferase
MPAALEGLDLRDATPADAAALADVFVEGFEGYRELAVGELRVPDRGIVVRDLAARIGTPPVWCRLAEGGDGIAGFVSLLPASQARRAVDDPALAHFWMLFVRPPWWGSGLASRLHGAAVAAARGRGYAAMRLFTPARQARARRFYEREGWTAAGAPELDPDIGLELVEYRRPL